MNSDKETDGRQRTGAPAGAPAGAPTITRSITIGRSAEDLSRRWLEPETLARVLAGFATVRASGDGRLHWKVEGPIGLTYSWESEIVENQPGRNVAWRSVPGADIPNEGSMRFGAAPADRGTVATLRFDFDPPGGSIGEAAMKLLGHKPLGLAADRTLGRFKSLVETGEIPTTERQPAARDDTR